MPSGCRNELRHEALCDSAAQFTHSKLVGMRTNVEIDDTLLAEAMAATGLRTKREVVEAGLRLLARQKRQAEDRKLFGRSPTGGDLHRERMDARDRPA